MHAWIDGCQVARLVCSGMLDKVPDLKLIVSHTGGTLPFLAGRLDSCVSGDEHLDGKLKHLPSHYLKVQRGLLMHGIHPRPHTLHHLLVSLLSAASVPVNARAAHAL